MKRIASLTAAATTAAMIASPAFAQGMNLQQGATTLGTTLLIVFGVLVLVVAGWKGWEAVLDHRSVIPSVIGLVFGIALTFGGAWWLTQLGAGGGAVGALNL